MCAFSEPVPLPKGLWPLKVLEPLLLWPLFVERSAVWGKDGFAFRLDDGWRLSGSSFVQSSSSLGTHWAAPPAPRMLFFPASMLALRRFSSVRVQGQACANIVLRPVSGKFWCNCNANACVLQAQDMRSGARPLEGRLDWNRPVDSSCRKHQGDHCWVKGAQGRSVLAAELHAGCGDMGQE